MNILKYIDIPYLLVSLIIGFVMVYIMKHTHTRTIVLFPTPENVDNIQYKHHSGLCFSPEPVETQCSVDTKEYSSSILEE